MRDRGTTNSDMPRAMIPLGSDIAAMAFVQSSSLCQGLDDEQLAKLYESGIVLEYGLAEVVFAQGSQDDALYLVLEGSVSVRRTHEGQVIELADLDRQGVFGEIAVLTQQARTASVVTRTDARLIRLAGDVVREVAEAVPKLGRKLAGLMAARHKDTEKKLG